RNTKQFQYFAGVIQWQNASFPNCIRGFDSLRPLQIFRSVLRTACREAASWTKPLKVAVNVSAAQLYNSSFVQELHQILLETGLPPRRLEIEITGTALVRDFNRALATLRQIKARGVAIAMD